MLSLFKNITFCNKRKNIGATVVEYALIASLISTMLIVGYRTVGTSYTRIYNNISNGLDKAM